MDFLRGSADGERHARRPPHRGAGAQGRLPPVQDHAGLSRAAPGGWDCHGLPVEVAVEKELGLSAKKDIEAYGIAEFNARCRESVLRHVDAFAEMTERMGYWVDLSAAYRTMDPDYIESVWWSLKADLRPGPAGPGLPDQPLLPALRDAAVRPRDGPAGRVPDGHRPVGDRPVPAADAARRGAAAAARRRPAGLDDHAVDAGVQHRGGGAPGRDLRGRPQSRRRRPGGRGRRPVRPGARRGLAHRRPGSAAPSWPGRSTSRRSSSSTCRTRTGW